MTTQTDYVMLTAADLADLPTDMKDVLDLTTKIDYPTTSVTDLKAMIKEWSANKSRFSSQIATATKHIAARRAHRATRDARCAA